MHPGLVSISVYIYVCMNSGFYKLVGLCFVGDAEGTRSGTFLEVGKGTSEDCL